MPLSIELKPHERVIIGGSVVVNGGRRNSITILGKQPVLREKDILRAEDAVTPATRIYFHVQSLLLDGELDVVADAILTNTRDFILDHPEARDVVEAMTAHVLGGEHYKALREARQLCDIERDALIPVPGL